MFRYLAIAWNNQEPGQSERAQALCLRAQRPSLALQVVLNRRGLMVLCANSNAGAYVAHPLTRDAGVVLGLLYRRHSDVENDSPNPPVSLNESDSADILRTEGRALVNNYWGDYVAVLMGDQSDAINIIKDPTGNLPCYRTSWQGISIVFSSIADCLGIGITGFNVNWDYVAARLASGGFDEEHDPLDGVSRVHRGQCHAYIASMPNRRVDQFYWSPTRISENAQPLAHTQAAARVLRATVRSATHTLAASHDQMLLRLSGGLDSSIIAGCLHDAPTRPSVTAFTYYVLGGRSDERRWARLAASHSKIPHVEYALDFTNTKLDSILEIRPTVEPCPAFTYFLRGALERDLARATGVTAIVSGDGGDSQFGRHSISLAVDDYLNRNGLKWKAVPLAAQVALAEDTLVWEVLAGAIQRWVTGGRMDDFRQKLLRAATLGPERIRERALSRSDYPHPWFEGLARVPWCTIQRLGNLMMAPEFYDPFCDVRDPLPAVVSPLYAQPVVEACLRIPVYVHFHQGHDRGLARLAFAEELDPAIRQRRWKDRAPGSVEAITFRNKKFLRDVLLGGVLAQQGLINPTSIEHVLAGGASQREFSVIQLYSYLDLELWARHFATDQRKEMVA
jgi:asparagine synthase (glutamine-hydrolysing)